MNSILIYWPLSTYTPLSNQKSQISDKYTEETKGGYSGSWIEKKSNCQWKRDCSLFYNFIGTVLSMPFFPYHFVRTILSNTILSVYHFIHTILS